MKWKKSVVLLLMLCLLAACSSMIAVPSQTATTLTGTQSQHDTTPSEGLGNSIASITCPTIIRGLPNDTDVEGKIVLTGTKLESIPPFLQDINTGSRLDLPHLENYKTIYYAVSPNRKWLTYTLSWQRLSPIFEVLDEKMILMATDGSLYKTLQMEKEWLNYIWLDDEHLLISHRREKFDRYPFSTKLNPFSGQREELPADFPNIAQEYSILNWGFYTSSAVVYNLTSTRVMYPSLSTLVLWDVSSQSIVTQFMTRDGGGKFPKLSPDGKGLAIITDGSSNKQRNPYYNTDDFFYISWDGQVSRLSFLSDQYLSVTIHAYNWSPDGQRIAFWMTDNRADVYKDIRLAVLDLKLGKVTIFCDLGSPFSNNLGDPDVGPIWSPDGEKVVIATGDTTNGSEQTQVTVVDFANNNAYIIANNLEPKGWIATTP